MNYTNFSKGKKTVSMTLDKYT